MDADILLFSKKRAAALLGGLGVRTIEYMIAAGELQVRRVGRRVLITRASLEKFSMRDHPSPRPRAEALSLHDRRGGERET